jgi:hypothetical protein
MGTSKHIHSSAAFLFEVPGLDLPRGIQELQKGGTGPIHSRTCHVTIAGRNRRAKQGCLALEGLFQAAEVLKCHGFRTAMGEF